MTNNQTLSFACLFLCCLAGSASAQPGLLGGAGTSSRDGWKFSVSYVVKPPLMPGQTSSIKGNTDVMHTEAKDGSPVIFHRFLTDPASRTYCGYDVVVEPIGDTHTARLRFQPFSLRADQLTAQYHAADFRALAVPQFPSETFQSGQTIAIDLMANPVTGQRIVDYIEVSYEPGGYVAGTAPPRDFQVSDVLLNIAVPSLRVNGAAVSPGIVAAQMIRRRLVWLSVPGGKRFLLALCPYPGYPFQKSGVANSYTLSFSWNGDRYELQTRAPITESSGAWNLYVLASPSDAAQGTGTEFSFGAVDSVAEFLSHPQ